MSDERRMLIGGAMVRGEGKMLAVVNPATGQVFTEVPTASHEQAEHTVAAAKAAFASWSRTSIEERRDAISRLRDLISDKSEEFAHSIVMEQGKPLRDARAEVERAKELARYHARLELPQVAYQNDRGKTIETFYSPLGVVVGIVPWNYPFSLGILKLVPAILMGNTFIWKPAPTTPVTSLLMGELMRDLLPTGVVNVIADSGELGEFFTKHPDVAAVTFIGSTPTGKKVQAAGASTLKRVSLELGGNDAAIVLDDADVLEMAPKIFESAFADSGQACVAIKRVYAHDKVYDKLCEELSRLADNVVVGDGLDERSMIGPVQNKAQFERAKHYIEIAERDGNVIAGGNSPDAGGFFVRPTVVRDIDHHSPLVSEEQFAPILPVVRYDDLEKALAMTNDSRYGLGGSVWSSNGDRAKDVAKRIEAGTVWVNDHCHLPVDVPLRGAKESGVGADYGIEGVLEYARVSILNTVS